MPLYLTEHDVVSLFEPADTLASRIASEYQGAVSGLQIDSILYLAAILLVISLITNVAAQTVVRRTAASSSDRDTPAGGTWSRHIAMSPPRLA